MARKLPPEVAAKLGRRRGTAATRKLALEMFKPIFEARQRHFPLWADRTLAGVLCEHCGQPVDPIHLCKRSGDGPRSSKS